MKINAVFQTVLHLAVVMEIIYISISISGCSSPQYKYIAVSHLCYPNINNSYIHLRLPEKSGNSYLVLCFDKEEELADDLRKEIPVYIRLAARANNTTDLAHSRVVSPPFILNDCDSLIRDTYILHIKLETASYSYQTSYTDYKSTNYMYAPNKTTSTTTITTDRIFKYICKFRMCYNTTELLNDSVDSYIGSSASIELSQKLAAKLFCYYECQLGRQYLAYYYLKDINDEFATIDNNIDNIKHDWKNFNRTDSAKSIVALKSIVTSLKEQIPRVQDDSDLALLYYDIGVLQLIASNFTDAKYYLLKARDAFPGYKYDLNDLIKKFQIDKDSQ